jgi:anti-sigma factor RsiW
MTPHNAEGVHLSEVQFGEMLAGSSSTGQPDAHLLRCDECAAEIAAIRESLSLFRDATRAYADAELRRMPQMTLPTRRLISPAFQPTWWLAAAAFLLTALLPIQLQRQQRFRSMAAEANSASAPVASKLDSDEALLEDVDRESSASLPSPMQALANPTTSLDPSTP